MRPQDILLDDETLFSNEEIFTPSYVPEEYLHRDDQVKEISLSLKPGLRGVNPINTLVHGPPGTGKTTAVKYLFEEVGKLSSKLQTVYVNCDDYNTRFGVFSNRRLNFLISASFQRRLFLAICSSVFTCVSCELSCWWSGLGS